MSLKLNSSGGGSITLQEPSTASNRTLTLPDNTGNLISSADSGTVSQTMLASGVAGNGPAFSAYASGATNTANNTATKVVLAAEEYDTANCFDTSASRFTPNVAGYYFVTANVYYGSGGPMYSMIYKNGSLYRYGTQSMSASGMGQTSVTTMVYLNGTTDYIEFYWLQTTGVTVNSSAGNTVTYFTGFLARAA